MLLNAANCSYANFVTPLSAVEPDNPFKRPNGMKKLPSSVILSLMLAGQAALAADSAKPAAALPAPATTTQLAVAAPELRLRSPSPQAGAVQMIAIGDSRLGQPRTPAAAESRPDNAAAERLPSTPVALASLLLVICILIGRRNT